MAARIRLLAASSVILLSVFTWSRADDQVAVVKPKPDHRPEVEVVFCLDTTGSMGGMIDNAKKKIWTIANQIATGVPAPNIKVGLVAYRDRGDAYITKVFDLTDDLDAVHQQLLSFRADGGGDEPESVNEALHDAVTKILWSRNKQTLKLIFLVGDAPPHMDYKDDVPYSESCKLATERGIIINTVLCGNSAAAQKHWSEICALTQGDLIKLDSQGGSAVAITTPFDTELAMLNREMANTTIVFGDGKMQKDALARDGAGGGLGTVAQGSLGGSSKLALSAPAAPEKAAEAADRASYVAKQFSGGNSYDLLWNVQNAKVKLEELNSEQLPPEMRKMTLAEQKTHLAQVDEKRQELTKKVLELDKNRNDYIAKKQAEAAANRQPDSFDRQILEVLQNQAGRQNIIQYNGAGKNKATP